MLATIVLNLLNMNNIRAMLHEIPIFFSLCSMLPKMTMDLEITNFSSFRFLDLKKIKKKIRFSFLVLSFVNYGMTNLLGVGGKNKTFQLLSFDLNLGSEFRRPLFASGFGPQSKSSKRNTSLKNIN